jgi:hypothetical protein
MGLVSDSVSVTIARDVLLGVSLFAAVGWGCQLFDASFSTYLVVVQLGVFALFGASLIVWRAGGGPQRAEGRSRSFLALAVAVVVGGVTVIAAPAFDVDGDGYEHVAYTRTIVADDELLPAGVLAPLLTAETPSGPDPRKGLLHPTMAAVSELAGLDPVAVWRWSCAFFAPVAVLAFFAFARLLLPGTAWVVAALVLLVLFQMGFGIDFLTTAGLGRNIALVFAWVLFVTVIESCRRPQPAGFVVLGLLVVGGALVHIVVAACLALMLASLFLFYRVFPVDLRGLVRVTVVSLVCGVAVLVWKVGVSGPWGGGHGVYERLLFFSAIGDALFVPRPVAIAEDNGLVFLLGLGMIPALLFVRRHRRFALMNLALALPPVLVALNPLVVPRIYTGDLSFPNAILLGVPSWPIIALGVGSLVIGARRGGLWRRLVGLVVLFVFAELLLPGVRQLVSEVRAMGPAREAAPLGRASRAPAFENLVEFLDTRIGTGSVVLSDPRTSYALSARCNVKVVRLPGKRGATLAQERILRAKAVGNTLSQHTTPIEAAAVVEMFGVDYIVLDGSPGARCETGFGDWDSRAVDTIKLKLGSMEGAVEMVYEDAGYVVYEVGPEPPTRFSWYPDLPFSVPPPVALLPCVTPAAPVAPRVTAVGVTPREVLAGEDIELSIRYRRDDQPPSDLPLVVAVRLEQAEYFDSRRAYPGARYVRAMRERRGGLVRHEVFRMPFGGFFTPEMWPIGRDVYETFTLRVPRDLREGTYRMRLETGYGNWSSNVTLRDLLYNEGSFTGPVCAELTVRHFLTR